MRIRKRKAEEAKAKRGLAYRAMVAITTIIATFQYGPRLFLLIRTKLQPIMAKFNTSSGDRATSRPAHTPA